MNGGYRGGQGSGRGSGYNGPDYGEDGYGSPRRPAGRPSRGDWERDQNGARPGGAADGYAGQGYEQPGYGAQDFDGRGSVSQPGYPGQQGYPSPGYGTAGYDTPGYDAPGYDTAGYDTAGYDGQGYGPQGGRPGTGASPAYPPGPASGPQPYQRSGPQPVQRGTGSQPVQPVQRGAAGPGGEAGTGGHKIQRLTGPRRMAGGYDDEYRYGQPGNPDWDDRGDDSFLPGFSGGDDFDGRGRGRDPRSRDPRDRDPRDRDPRDRDPRDRDPRDWDNRGRDPRDPRGRGDDRGPGGRGPGGRGPDGWEGRDGRDPGRRDPGGRDGRDRRDSRDREAWSQFHTEKRRRSPVRRLAPWIALLVILVPVVIGVLYVYGRYEAKYHPADYSGSGTGEVTIQVMSGDTAFTLAPRLLAAGVIASTRSFENAAEAAPANGPTLEAGYFELHRHMQASLAYAYLTNPKNMLQTVVTIPEGKRVSQTIAILSQKTGIPLKDFQQVIDHPAQLGLPSYAKGVKGFPDSAVEGFLFPATYAITPHETALQILQAMVDRFNVEAQSINITAAAASVHLTPYQLIIEASMAQAEGGSVSDYPKIATVIKNRLAAGMTMGFDSVLFYGLNTYGINVTSQQEATKNPYNDMTEHTGLPPTPIDNPGDLAIKGILHPTPGDWLYFLTNTGGKSTFSRTPLTGQ